MDLSLRRLRMLREVGRRGGVGAAARYLSCSTSGVSQQIAALEDQLDVSLLERVGRTVRLTEAGRILVQHADTLFEAESRALAAVEQSRGNLAGQLTVGVFATVVASVMPAVLRETAATYPNLRVHTREIDPETAPSALRDGDIDLAFLIDYPNASEPWPRSLTVVPLGVDRLSLAAPHGRHRERKMPLAHAAADTWILSGEHTYYGRAVRAACTAAGFEPRVEHEVDAQATAMTMVSQKLGVTLISDLGRVFRPTGIDFIELDEPIYRHLLLGYNTSGSGRPTVSAVVDSIKRASAAVLTPSTS